MKQQQRQRQTKEPLPRNKNAMIYVSRVLHEWKQQDPMERIPLNNVDLTEKMNATLRSLNAKPIAQQSFGQWVKGVHAPKDPTIIRAFALTFNRDITEAFQGFGVEYNPSDSFASLYQAVEAQKWDDRDTLLNGLKPTLSEDWEKEQDKESDDIPLWIIIAQAVLKSDIDLHTKAQRVAHIARAVTFLTSAEVVPLRQRLRREAGLSSASDTK